LSIYERRRKAEERKRGDREKIGAALGKVSQQDWDEAVQGIVNEAKAGKAGAITASSSWSSSTWERSGRAPRRCPRRARSLSKSGRSSVSCWTRRRAGEKSRTERDRRYNLSERGEAGIVGTTSRKEDEPSAALCRHVEKDLHPGSMADPQGDCRRRRLWSVTSRTNPAE
jgi:hypothetical protein